jgi:WS/DGAT/MGAT family acyltransferase
MAPSFERLSFLDTSFLALETPSTHMHVGSVLTFDASTLSDEHGGLDIDLIRDYIRGRLHMATRYRQRLAWIPIEQYPVWIDDEHFHLEYHVRHTALPSPGSEDQLRTLAGRIKIHHCMIDGVAGAELMAMLLNFGPDRTMLPAREWAPKPTPSDAELIVAESARLTRSVIDQAKGLFDGLPGLAGRLAGRVQQASQTLRSGWLTPSTPTPLNEQIGPNRRFAWLDTPLDTIKGVRRATGASINDLVLTIVSGAIRHFLVEHRGFEPSSGGYRAMVPVSVREGAAEQLGNQVAMWLVELPIHEADALARLAAISAETTRLKETNEAEGATALVDAASGTPVALLSLGLKAAAERRPFNLTITNVPGPQFPLYLLDAQMEATYPLVPLWHHHGLSIALFSYAGAINWGVVADWDLVPDLEEFIECLDRSVAELVEATS